MGEKDTKQDLVGLVPEKEVNSVNKQELEERQENLPNNQDLEEDQESSPNSQELEEKQRDQINAEYRSRLFGFLFGREENKEWTLSLYNAVNGTNHKDPADITINTIEDVLYLGMRNDLSILVSADVSIYRTMELYEHQSSFNPNMP